MGSSSRPVEVQGADQLICRTIHSRSLPCGFQCMEVVGISAPKALTVPSKSVRSCMSSLSLFLSERAHVAECKPDRLAVVQFVEEQY